MAQTPPCADEWNYVVAPRDTLIGLVARLACLLAQSGLFDGCCFGLIMAASSSHDETAMKKPLQAPQKSPRTVPVKAYDDQLPATVPDAQESNSESVWAMFQQSIIHTEERVAVAVELAAAKAKDEAASAANPPPQSDPTAPEHESDFADTTFENTSFSVLPNDATQPAPLKPEGQ